MNTRAADAAALAKGVVEDLDRGLPVEQQEARNRTTRRRSRRPVTDFRRLRAPGERDRDQGRRCS